MAITAVPGSVTNASGPLCTVPAGVGSVTISVAAANTTVVYVTTVTPATVANGAAVVGGASVTIPLYPGSKGTNLYAIANVAGPTPVGVFISTGS